MLNLRPVCEKYQGTIDYDVEWRTVNVFEELGAVVSTLSALRPLCSNFRKFLFF